MSAEAKQTIARLIPMLTASEKQEVKALLSLGDKNGIDPGMADWLLVGMADYLVVRGYLHRSSAIQSLSARHSFKTYKKKSPAVLQWLESKIPGKRLRVSLGILAASCLGSYIDKHAPTENMCANMLLFVEKIPEAIEEAFPGYVSSGFLSFILDRKGVVNDTST